MGRTSTAYWRAAHRCFDPPSGCSRLRAGRRRGRGL